MNPIGAGDELDHVPRNPGCPSGSLNETGWSAFRFLYGAWDRVWVRADMFGEWNRSETCIPSLHNCGACVHGCGAWSSVRFSFRKVASGKTPTRELEAR